MAWLNSLLIVIQVICAVSIIVLILLQHGKGADMGAAFGSGASGSLFGATGSANFLSRSTAVLATIFFLTTIGLAYMTTAARSSAGRGGGGAGVMSTVGKSSPAAPAAPVTPLAPPAAGGGQPANSSTPATSTAPAAGGSETKSPAERPTDIPK
ncbi:MAG: preprotein translocase subunit SecG [Burkholderiaceae bacterium]|nr:preprotein translocase subunit SecG [Burkholderiaceae bacterium]